MPTDLYTNHVINFDTDFYNQHGTAGYTLDYTELPVLVDEKDKVFVNFIFYCNFC